MAEITKNKTSSSANKATIIIFFILISLRISDDYLPKLLLGVDEIPNWHSIIFTFITFSLTCLTIFANRNNLYQFHIDSTFLPIFLISGITVSIFYLPTGVGIFTGLIMLIVFAIIKNNIVNINSGRINYIQVFLFLFVGIVPNLLYYLIFIMPNAEISIHIHGSILQALFESRFHDVVFEEVLYRGTLWMLLKELKLSDLQIIVVQTLAFWFSHYHYIGEPIKFWVYLPWVSLLLGVLVWRSKSISPSILVHFLYNVLMSLLRQSI